MRHSENDLRKPGGGNSDGVACTEEAKLCPDGSAVGRSGPTCEFEPCPTLAPGQPSVTPQFDSQNPYNYANPNLPAFAEAKDGCIVSGCSSHVCRNPNTSEDATASSEGGITTCEYRAEYACLKLAVCEIQSDGNCGWSETYEYGQCMETIPQNSL